ncbi:hypothetical protein DAEQUDRAFT_814956 [Daedalea quercina L-15889]|uniref:Uncharacterized protein n=1 Tax=Daedalea quercina L-15889 TaxID=1314783 RepID=A0A165LHY6_9APHY|nr:hypothetical protein DAEQUDRAFT_814956 [Daedalea quercina L-15889]
MSTTKTNTTYRGAEQKSQTSLHDVSVGRSAPSLLASVLSRVYAEDTKNNNNTSRTKKRPAPDDGHAVEFAHSTNNTSAFSRRKKPRTVRRERAAPVNRIRGSWRLRPGTHSGRRDALHTGSTFIMPDSLPDPSLPPVTSENTTHRVASHAAPVGTFTRTTQHGLGLLVTVPAANDHVLAFNEYPCTPPQDDVSRWVGPTSQRDQVATPDAGPPHQWNIPDPLYYTSTWQSQDAPAQTAPQVSVWSNVEDVQHPTVSESVLHHDSEFTGHLWSTQHPALPSSGCEGSYTHPHVGQLLRADELAYVRADCTREFLARLAPLLVPFSNATDFEDAPIRPDEHTPILPEDFWVTVARCISDSNWDAPGAIDLAIEACTRHLSSALEAWASSRVAMSDMTSHQHTYVPGHEMMTP